MKIYLECINDIYYAKTKDNYDIDVHPSSSSDYENCLNETNILIREETERLYGFEIKDGILHLIMNGISIPTYYGNLEDYCHRIRRKFLDIMDSGIEIETCNNLSRIVVYSLAKYLGIETTPTYDGSLSNGGAEFKMSIKDWLKMLDYIKPTVRTMSTHIHCSDQKVLSTLIMQYESKLTDLPNDDEVGIAFNRHYSQYALRKIRPYVEERYVAVSLPSFVIDKYNRIWITSQRITVEFRNLNLNTKKLVESFIEFLKTIAQGYVYKDAFDIVYYGKKIDQCKKVDQYEIEIYNNTVIDLDERTIYYSSEYQREHEFEEVD